MAKTAAVDTPSALDRYFEISKRGSTVSTEIRAGVVTFFAMAYIIILNPLILGTGADINGTVLGVPQVAAATALAAGVMTIAFNAIAKYPFGIATGLDVTVSYGATLAIEHATFTVPVGSVMGLIGRMAPANPPSSKPASNSWTTPVTCDFSGNPWKRCAARWHTCRRLPRWTGTIPLPWNRW